MKAHLVPWDGVDAAGLAGELRAAGTERATSIAAAVAATIERVRTEGDSALLDLTHQHDDVRIGSPRIDPGAVEAALEQLDPELRTALERSAAAIRTVAEAQAASTVEPDLEAGQRVTVAEVAVGAAGIYAPGGRSPYPSSVLMGVIPALAAGVQRVAVASPPGPDGLPATPVLAAAAIAGAHEVYAMGGAQAIAAFAYGTESVGAVDVIAGPGGPWVQEAKLACARQVGIDGYAGPSELLVICDGSADLHWMALDLLAQGEHGDDGLLVAASPDRDLLAALGKELERLASERPSVLATTVKLIVTPHLDAAVELAQALAPEHLELACDDAAVRVERITTAGCTFIDVGGGAAFGDYSAGSNHVLPTGGSGRFSGPLGPSTFRRRISRVAIDDAAAAALAPAAEAIAAAEGFPVHAESAAARSVGPAERSS